MLRKEILGTKIKTQSGLSKPITIAQPKDDSDYKSENFLDTDILLAKDIKQFVKGQEIDTSGLFKLNTRNNVNSSTTLYWESSKKYTLFNKHGMAVANMSLDSSVPSIMVVSSNITNPGPLYTSTVGGSLQLYQYTSDIDNALQKITKSTFSANQLYMNKDAQTDLPKLQLGLTDVTYNNTRQYGLYIENAKNESDKYKPAIIVGSPSTAFLAIRDTDFNMYSDGGKKQVTVSPEKITFNDNIVIDNGNVPTLSVAGSKSNYISIYPTYISGNFYNNPRNDEFQIISVMGNNAGIAMTIDLVEPLYNETTFSNVLFAQKIRTSRYGLELTDDGTDVSNKETKAWTLDGNYADLTKYVESSALEDKLKGYADLSKSNTFAGRIVANGGITVSGGIVEYGNFNFGDGVIRGNVSIGKLKEGNNGYLVCADINNQSTTKVYTTNGGIVDLKNAASPLGAELKCDRFSDTDDLKKITISDDVQLYVNTSYIRTIYGGEGSDNQYYELNVGVVCASQGDFPDKLVLDNSGLWNIKTDISSYSDGQYFIKFVPSNETIGKYDMEMSNVRSISFSAESSENKFFATNGTIQETVLKSDYDALVARVAALEAKVAN